MNIYFPFRIDNAGRVDEASLEDHINQLIQQVLFTSTGERVNRPDFGSELMRMVFSANSDVMTAANEFLVQSSLQKWLGDLIQIENVSIENSDTTLNVTVQYLIRQTQSRQIKNFVNTGNNAM